MKTKLIAAGLAVLLLQPAFAQQPATSAPDAKAQQAPSAAELDAQYAKMQEQMKQMHDQMAKICGPGMGGHMMQWGDYRALTPEQLRERQYMMERWMPMQQMMMDQMMQHQHWMQPQASPTAPAKKK